jgi:tetratricopeptide (TPR) repeat protein
LGGEDKLKDWTTLDVCEYLLKTSDEDPSGLATFFQRSWYKEIDQTHIFAIYPWNCCFMGVMNTLFPHFQDGHNNTVVWLNTRSQSGHSPDSFRYIFEHIKHVTVVFDFWESVSQPVSSNQLWYMVELYFATKWKCEIEMALLPEQLQSLHAKLRTEPITILRNLSVMYYEGLMDEVINSFDQEQPRIGFDMIRRQDPEFPQIACMIYQKLKSLILDFLIKSIKLESNGNRLDYSNYLFALGVFVLKDCEDVSESVADAIKHFKISYEIRLEVLGNSNPKTWQARQNVCYCLYLQGNLYEAEESLEECFEWQKANLGQDHTDTIESAHVLAKVYLALQYDADAEPLLKDCLERRVRLLGEDHIDTQRVQFDLASFHLLYNRFDEALLLSETIYHKRKQRLGLSHPDTIDALVTLANICSKTKEDRADEFLLQCFDLKKMVYGENHLSTLTAMINIGMYYKGLQLYDKAEEWYRRCINISNEAIGPSHPTTVGVKNNLAVLLANVGRVQDSIDVFLDNYRCVTQAEKGETSELARKIIKNLQLLLQKEGRVDEIDDLLNSALSTTQQQNEDFIIDDTVPDSSNKIGKIRTVSWSSSY